METKISLGISAVAWLFKQLKRHFCICINLIFRPRIKFEFKPHIIQLLLDENQAHVHCLAIILTPPKDIKIKADSIKFNNESYTYLFQGLSNIANKEHNSELLRYFKDNWLDITQGTKYIDAKKYEPLILPLSMVGSYAKFLTSSSKNSLLFNSRSKLSISLNFSGKTFYYGLDFIMVYSKVIMHLAGRLEEIKTLKEQYKELVI